MTDHEHYMQMAIDLAAQARGFTSPNPCVGAVVVKDGRIVGQGFHRAAGCPHAEVEALNDAGEDARGATIYVRLEPCNHFGKTPPCTHKILECGIRKVVAGCMDPNPDVCGGGLQYLADHGVEVVSGVLEQKAEALIEDFIWYIRNRTPFVTLKCAATLDGRISTVTGDSKWITCEKSRAFGHRLRHESDAILIGSGTLHADDPSLTARIKDFRAKDPLRVILDTNLTIKHNAKVLTQESDAQTLIVSGPDASYDKKIMLEDMGAVVIDVPLGDKGLDLNALMVKLGQMSVSSLLIEGGGTVAGSALRTGIVNRVMYFMAAKFLGGNDGTAVFCGPGPKLIKDAFELENVEIRRFDSDILVQGYLK